MKKIQKIANIAFIFMLGVFLWLDAGYTTPALRNNLMFDNISKEADVRRFEDRMTATDENDYLADIPGEVISIVHNFTSFNAFEKWLEHIFLDISVGGRFSKEVLSFLETLTLLFGFESKIDEGLLDSKCSILKNLQVDEKDKGRIYRTFYSSEKYEYNDEMKWEPDTMWETIEAQLYKTLKDIVHTENNNIELVSMIKQYKDLILKLESIISQIEGSDKKNVSLNVQEVIQKIMNFKSIISDAPMRYFDDMLKFNFIIDDSAMSKEDRESVITTYSDQVEKALKSQFNIRITKIRKEGAVNGFEAIDLFVQGWLNHKDLGNLPVKIQFRFKTVLYGESAMDYIYKRYGLWELPVWSKDINFYALKSFRELQEALFNNFRKYTINLIPDEPFLIQEHLTMPEGWLSQWGEEYAERLSRKEKERLKYEEISRYWDTKAERLGFNAVRSARYTPEQNEAFIREMQNKTFEVLEGRVEGKRVFELGVGIGAMTEGLAEKADAVVGNDISPKMLEKARERLKGFQNVTLYLGKITDLSLPPKSFDLVFSSLVLIHILNPEELKQTIKKMKELSNKVFIVEHTYQGEDFPSGKYTILYTIEEYEKLFEPYKLIMKIPHIYGKDRLTMMLFESPNVSEVGRIGLDKELTSIASPTDL